MLRVLAVSAALLAAGCAATPPPGPPPVRDPYLAAILPAASEAAPAARLDVARAGLRPWVLQIGAPPAAPEPATAWLGEGIGDFLAVRALLRAGLMTPDEAAAALNAALVAHDAAVSSPAAPARGTVLALRWDAEIRRATGSRLDLDDVLMSARDRRGLAPSETTGFVDRLMNAAWGSAQVNLREDVARYVVGREPVPVPEAPVDGCLIGRTTLTQAFDTGFDHTGSLASGVVKGVRRHGPAWASGVRNGQRLAGGRVAEGDTSREVELTLVDQRGRRKLVRYWPYGDEDRTVRAIVLRSDLSDAQLAACAKAMAG